MDRRRPWPLIENCFLHLPYCAICIYICFTYYIYIYIYAVQLSWKVSFFGLEIPSPARYPYLKSSNYRDSKSKFNRPARSQDKTESSKNADIQKKNNLFFFFLWKRSFIFLTPWAYACITHDSLYVYVQNSRSDKFPNCAFTLSSETNPSRSDFCTYITPFFFLSIWHAQPMKGFFLGERNCDHLHEEMCVSEPFFLDSHVKILMACTL